MKTSPRGLAEIAGHEGIVLEPYVDSVGVWTIGIGHTAAAGPPDPSAMPKGKAITLERAFQLFEKDIQTYEAAVEKAIKVSVTQAQFDAAVSFHYNTGSIAKATWVKTLNEGNVAKAAEQIMNWRRPPEIIPRRKKEQALFRDGTYGNGMATIFPADDRGRVQWSKGTTINVLERLMGGGRRPRQPDDPGVSDSPTVLEPRGLLGIIWDFIVRLFKKG